MRPFRPSVKFRFGLRGVVSALYAIKTVAQPWPAAIPSEGAEAASGVFFGWAGLIGAGHGVVTVMVVATGVSPE